MTNVELFINNRLCDVSSDFGVRLNRIFLNPGELNAKDAQYSYSITLPATPNNNAILGYANIEETRGKFNREYNAELIISSVRVFKGTFRMSEVRSTQYKGNLYVPANKSVKDIFGELKLSENPEYPLPFTDFAASLNGYNTGARTTPQPAIFPYTLYGLLPKVPGSGGEYTARDVWDDTVRVGMSDFPPSPNVLRLIRHLFESRGYNIVGNAFEDERLKQVYMSYKNDTSYTQPWNYGHHAKIRITGAWSNYANLRETPPVGSPPFERGVIESSVDDTIVYACDLFDSTNVRIDNIVDPGGNVKYSESDGYARTDVSIPVSGYYKVELKVNTGLLDGVLPGPLNDPPVIGTSGAGGRLGAIRSSVKLLRNNKQGDFNLASSRMDGTYYRDNLPQDTDSENRYAPYYYGGKIGSILFVDAAQNSNFIAGLQWGKRNNNDLNPTKGTGDTRWSQILVAKPAVSWDASRAGEGLARLAINNPEGYRRYGLPNVGNSPTWDDADTGRFKIELRNAPENEARRGYYEGAADNPELTAQGSVNCVVWLEAGESLTLADVSDRGTETWLSTYRGWVAKTVTFDLSITAFRADPSWLQVDTAGRGTGVMDWNDAGNFDVDTIDLMKFLPVDMKTDDFIDNVCKAFNLQVSQIDPVTFRLDVKQVNSPSGADFINLDNLASVRDRSNSPLGLPSLYKLGFTVDTEEEGYISTDDDGGGQYATDATEEKIVEQKSTFSYNWFKEIKQGNSVLPLAVISKHDVWADPEEMTRAEAMLKKYYDLALRFWYYDGLLNDIGAVIEFNSESLSVAKVSNSLPGLNVLNYKNERFTILDNFFTVLFSAESHYTEVEGYLTPIQYVAMSARSKAIFNGDIYRIAEISAYDPLGRNKTKIKLIPES